MFTATQMMFILGKAAVLALSFPTFLVGTQLMKTFQQSLPHEIANSAFDSGLYMAFQEPYRSYPCMPQKVHISQANNVENDRVSMTVSFTLNRDLCEHVKPTVIYGRGIFPEGEVVAVAEKLDFSFTSNETSGLYMSDWIYHMELPDLWAGLEKYWYRIQIDLDEEAARLSSSSSSSSDSLLRWFFLRGRQGRLGETPAYTFRTAPRIGSPTTIALIGDLGHAVNSTRTMNHILSATQTQLYPVSTFLIAGDLAYADGDMLGWEYWLNIMEPLFRSISMQVAAGNHEIECDNVTNNIFVPYESYFRNPNRIGPPEMLPVDENVRRHLPNETCIHPSGVSFHYDYGNSFYAYIHGLAHVVVLNSYTDTTTDSVQYKWLEKQLSEVDRMTTPWLLVSFHTPFHTTFIGHNDDMSTRVMMDSMEPLFLQYRVNIIIQGHNHAYVRTHSMAGHNVDPSGKGPIYLTIGTGGDSHAGPAIHEEPEEWVAKRDNLEYGFGNLFLANATHAHFKWVLDETVVAGSHDDFWLINQLSL